MGAELGDAAAVEDDDPVSVPDVGQPMGDQQRDPPAAVAGEPAQRREDGVLGARVHRRRGLVGDHEAGVAVEPAGDADPLPLPAGDVAAAPELAGQHRLPTVGELGDDGVGAGVAGGAGQDRDVGIGPLEAPDAHIVLGGHRPLVGSCSTTPTRACSSRTATATVSTPSQRTWPRSGR